MSTHADAREALLDAVAIEAAEREYQLSRYSDTELKRELARRETERLLRESHYGHNVDSTGHTPYCTDCDVYLA